MKKIVSFLRGRGPSGTQRSSLPDLFHAPVRGVLRSSSDVFVLKGTPRRQSSFFDELIHVELPEVGRISEDPSPMGSWVDPLCGLDQLQAMSRDKLVAQYGNKLANTVSSHLAISEIKETGPIKVQVPLAVGLSHQTVQELCQKNIESMWAENKGNAEIFKIFDHVFSEKSEAIRLIVASLKQKFPGENIRLMFRSTSLEDTEDDPNAGGNASVPRVEINRKHVSFAILTVLKSYFSDQSLGQRALSAHAVKFPLLAVMFQTMIEDVPGPVPRVVSGVLASCEPLGRTQGVMLVESTYGHGVGIVKSGLVETDSAYVGSNFCVIEASTKRERAYPQIHADLNTIPNAKETWDQASCDKAVLRTLYDVALSLEKLHKGPVDIEWVFDLETKVLSIVQVRPLILSTAPLSYLPLPPSSRFEDRFEVHSGDMAVRRVESSDIHIAISDEDAMHHLRKVGKDQLPKCSVLQEVPNSLSHPLMQMRALGVVVFQGNDHQIEYLNHQIESSSLLSICTQQGIINASNEMQMGVICHPSSSCPTGVYIHKEVASEAPVKTILTVDLAWVRYEEIMKAVRRLNGECNSEALDAILADCRTLYSGVLDTPAAPLFQQVWKLVEPLIEMIRTAPSMELSVLFVSQLRMLITRPIQAPKLGMSLLACLDVYEKFSNFSDHPDTKRLLPSELGLAFSLFKTPEFVTQSARADWLHFCVQSIGLKSKETLESLSQAVAFLFANDLGSLCVYPVIGNLQISFEAKVHQIEKDAANLEAYQHRLSGQKQLRILRNQTQGFETMDSDTDFHLRLDSLKEEVARADFSGFSELDSPKKKLLLRYATELVDVIDTSIKFLYGSPDYRHHIPIKTERMQEMLVVFRDVLLKLKTMLPESVQRTLLESNFKYYASFHNATFDLTLFDVSRWKFTRPYNAAYSEEDHCKEPTALDDFFTAIHQDALGVLQLASVAVLPEVRYQDPQFVAVHNQLTNELFQPNEGPSEHKMIHLLSYQVEGKQTQANYTIPLRTHSATLLVKTDEVTGLTSFQLTMKGENESNRWDASAYSARLLNTLPGVKASARSQESGLNISLTMEKDQTDVAMALIRLILGLSFSFSGHGSHIFMALNFPKEWGYSTKRIWNMNFIKESFFSEVLDYFSSFGLQPEALVQTVDAGTFNKSIYFSSGLSQFVEKQTDLKALYLEKVAGIIEQDRHQKIVNLERPFFLLQMIQTDSDRPYLEQLFLLYLEALKQLEALSESKESIKTMFLYAMWMLHAGRVLENPEDFLAFVKDHLDLEKPLQKMLYDYFVDESFDVNHSSEILAAKVDALSRYNCACIFGGYLTHFYD